MTKKSTKYRWALVIEDEPTINRICERILLSEGFKSDTVVNRLVALQMLCDNDYDLFPSDIRTPKMNGLDFNRYVEHVQPVLSGRFIFTTGDVLSNNYAG